jgi:antitoxin VapB
MEAGCGIDLKVGEAYAEAYGTPPAGITMSQEREASLFRNGRNQAVRIPREFEFSGERVIMRKVGRRLILEPMPKRKLADVLAELQPLPPGEVFPDVDERLRPLDRDPLD